MPSETAKPTRKRKADPFKYKATDEIEKIIVSNAKKIHRIADDLSQSAKRDDTKDKLFAIMEAADCTLTVLDYPGLGV